MSFTLVLFYVLLSACKAPCAYRLLHAYWEKKESRCQKTDSATSSTYYKSMLLAVNLIGQPQASLPPVSQQPTSEHPGLSENDCSLSGR